MIRSSRIPLWLMFCATISCTAGCAGFYQHRIITPEYELYTDESETELLSTGSRIARITGAYRKIFSGHQIRPPRIIYELDSLTQRSIYTAEIKQEGYYLPLLNLVRLNPQSPPDDGDAESTLLLHELGHHFLISAYPQIEERCWLNEGVACFLEVSYFDRDGTMQSPGFHSWLLSQAREALHVLGADELKTQLRELLDCSWYSFHFTGNKTWHYALSWALSYRLLHQLDGTMSQRIEALLEIDPRQVSKAIEGLPSWLDSGPDKELEALMKRSPRHHDWALDVWSRLTRVDGSRLIPWLSPLLGSSVERDRCRGFSMLARLLGERSYGTSPLEKTRLRRKLVSELEHGSPNCVISVAQALDEDTRSPLYLRPLVDLLESPHPRVRSESARALSRISSKPTITDPTFWQHASAEKRAVEVDEWQKWLDRLPIPQPRVGTQTQ